MKCCNLPKWCHNKNFGLFFLRIVVGGIFLSHGWEKFAYMSQTIAFFEQIKISAAFAYLVATIETVGGLALILGVFTWVATPLLAIVMLVAAFYVKWPIAYPTGGFLGAFRLIEIDVVLLTAVVTLFFTGAGKWSLAKFCRCKCHGKGDENCSICKVVGCHNGKCETENHEHHEHHHTDDSVTKM